MAYIAAMISIGITMVYAGGHEDLKVLLAIGILLYGAGIFIGDVVEKRTNDRIKSLEKEIEELKKNGSK